jgi:hypothetical protein
VPREKLDVCSIRSLALVSLILCQSSEGSRREKCEGIKEEVVILSVAVGAGNRKMSDGGRGGEWWCGGAVSH